MVEEHNPLVSILINNYNYEEFLKASIDSALAQTYSNIEVIVVDDGSTDNSPHIIASYGEKIIPIYQKNQGQAATFNQGFAASKGEIIFLLDADDIFHREKVRIVVDGLQANLESEWCFHPLALFSDENEEFNSALDRDSFNLNQEQIQQQDLRATMVMGKLGNPFKFPIPATSGMCLTRNLASKLLPMPTADGIVLNDSYLKFAALGISKGITINQKLAYQRIHNRNLFTTIDNSEASLKKKRKNNAAIFISTAYWLRTNFPSLIKYANNIFSVGLALHWLVNSQDRKSQEIAKEYCRQTKIKSIILIFMKSSYKYIRAL